jgi:hypothetical protein
MNKMVLILAMAMAVTFFGDVTAEGQDFTVSFVGRDHSNNWPYEPEGLPVVYYTVPPFQRPRSFIDSSNGEINAFSFLVVIQNLQKGAHQMSASASDWYDSLQFTITTGSGEAYHVSRRELVWKKNPIETWIFPGGGKRVIPVDFTSGDWQGLPAFADPYPQIESMTATFRHPDSTGKMVSVSSSPTDVYFSSESWAGLTADPKKIQIPGFSIGPQSDAGPGMESFVFFTPPLELSRYALIDESIEHPLVVTILRYASPEKAKRVFEASGRDRQAGPQPLKMAHWDAAHRWIAYRGASDTYLLKGDYVISLFRLPLDLPDAKKSQLFEALVNYTTKTEPDDPANGSAAKVTLKFVRVDSEETNGENGYGKNAVDGNPNTYWHTQWHDKSPGLPHEIVIELDPPSIIKGFTYLPRQDESDHGTIKDFEFYVSDDGKNFGEPVRKGEFAPGKDEKIETFSPIKCRFFKLKAISEINGLPWASAAEIRVIQCGEDAFPRDYWRGDIGATAVPQDSTEPDAIDSFVAVLSADHGLWLNGTDPIAGVQAASPEEVAAKTLRTAKFESGLMTSYRILDIRWVRIGEIPGSLIAVLIDTNLGQMIVLMNYVKGNGSMPGHWWRRIYDAHAPIHRLY